MMQPAQHIKSQQYYNMIIINNSAFIILGNDSATPKKVKQGVVKFQTPTKGKVTSWVIFEDENGNEVINGLHKEHLQDDFIGKDILATLHLSYKSELEVLNPSLTITIE